MMRLTLRTLLAYLDDVLAPADTKLIGQKIQESPMAQLLVSRIREVMRRRRLKAPELIGPEMGIDPNIVSQYLDNTLPDARYADVERVLLASDEMLAEAASCHQILTLILSEQPEVSTSSLERLYALGPMESGSQLAVPAAAATVSKRTPQSLSTRNGVAKSVEQMTKPTVDDNERTTAVPDYLKPAPWPQRVFPSAVIALLVIVCVIVLVPGLKSSVQHVNNEIQRKGRDNGPDSRNLEGETVATDSDKSKADKSEVEVASTTHTNTTVPGSSNSEIQRSLPVGVDPTPPEDVAEEITANVKPKVGDVDPAMSAVGPQPAPMEDANPGPPAVPKSAPLSPELLKDLLINYSSNEGVIVRLDELHNHWLKVSHRSPLKPDEIIANLEPFESVLEFEKSNVRATLIGETYLKMLNPNDAGLQGIGIGRGRLLLQANRHDEKQKVVFGIAIGADIWKLELQTSETICAIEVNARESTQFQKLNDYHWFQATLYVISGSVKWTNREGKSQEIPDHMALNVIPELAAAVRSVPIEFQFTPDWCDSSKRKASPFRRYQSTFEKSIDSDQPVEQSMLTLVNSRTTPKIAELAARALSVMDNYVGLVETLAKCQYEEARFAARDGLRIWLPMSPEHGPLLMSRLETHYSPADANAVYRMLWGFSRDDVKDKRETAIQLITCLRSQRIEIRELADYWVKRLTGRKSEFRASAPENYREPQVLRLESQVNRDNGLIKSQ